MDLKVSRPQETNACKKLKLRIPPRQRITTLEEFMSYAIISYTTIGPQQLIMNHICKYLAYVVICVVAI
jgi:hypothetical protein